jgi:arylsulfatase A-like enzyme/Flp pilus assembly protein TadD
MFRRFPTFCSALPFLLAVGIALASVAYAQSSSAGATSPKTTPQTGASRTNASRTNSSKPRAAKPNVILITIDTLRADHVGCYGAQTVKTPTIDALANDGVVFERAISQVPLTWPSHAVILTGTYPFQNGVQDFTGQPLAPQFRTIAQAFQQAGYATGAVISAFVLDRSWGLARGFDSYDDAFAAKTFATKQIGLVERPAGESVAHAILWLNNISFNKLASQKNSANKNSLTNSLITTTPRPFFLWLHLYDPHSPYDSPEPYRSEYRTHPYDGAIAYADHELGNLIAWLKRNHLYDSSLIAVLSDHGESLGEHGEDEHGFFVYNATVHVPLILKPPAGQGISAGRRSEPVETTAIAPTLLELAGVEDSTDPIHAQFQSHSLLPRGASPLTRNDAAHQTENAPAYSETFYPFSSFGWSPLRALESERFHYIDAPKPELYDLLADPGETHNLAASESATVAVFREKMQTLLAHNPFTRQNTAANLNPDAQDKLRALGYFGFRAPSVDLPQQLADSKLADPKEKLWEFNSILKAGDAFQLHEDDRADALLQQVQEKDPQIYVIPFMLGESALRRENWQEAVDQLQRCLALNPNFDNAMIGLARALTRLGRTDEAKTWLQKTLQINPQNYRAWYEIGLLDAKSSPVAALYSYEKAIEIQPNFSPAQRETGLALYQQKDYINAATHLEKAISLGLDDARLHNFLGICYSQTHRMSQAVREHQLAIKLDPKLAEAHLNLAYAYQHVGKITSAHSEYATACQLEPKFCAFVPK